MITVTPRKPTHTAVLIVCLLGVCSAVLGAALCVGSAVDAAPGSYPDWLAAFATLAALAAASYAAVETSGAFALERKRDRQNQDDRRRHQAELVAVLAGRVSWQGPRVDHRFEPGIPTARAVTGVWRPDDIIVVVRNASSMPIHHLTIEVYFQDPRNDQWLIAGQCPVFDPETRGASLVEQTSPINIVSDELISTMTSVLERIPDAADGPVPITLGWTFNDNGDTRWQRRPGEGLVEIRH